MLVTTDYFVGELLIPNLSGNGAVIEARKAEVTRFISIHEPKYLEKLLGTAIYALFKTGIASTNPEERWTDLKNKLINEELKTSPIAEYVYYHYMRHKMTLTAGNGEVNMLSENSENVLNTDKLISAWSNMVDTSRQIWEWMYSSTTLFPDFNRLSPFPFAKINLFNI